MTGHAGQPAVASMVSRCVVSSPPPALHSSEPVRSRSRQSRTELGPARSVVARAYLRNAPSVKASSFPNRHGRWGRMHVPLCLRAQADKTTVGLRMVKW